MSDDEFEWDTVKALANLRKHGVDFVDAQRVFDDVFSVHNLDSDPGYGEHRMIAIGTVNGVVLTVVYTERGERTRLISAWKATRHEQREYYSNQTPE